MYLLNYQLLFLGRLHISTAVYYSSDGSVLLLKYALTTKSRAVTTA